MFCPLYKGADFTERQLFGGGALALPCRISKEMEKKLVL